MVNRVRGFLAAATGGVRAALSLVTVLGRWVAITSVALIVIGFRMNWSELTLAGLTLLAVLVVALPWTIGSGPDHITLSVDPPRVSVGDMSVARITATAPAASRTRGLRIEVPITGAARPGNASPGLGAVDLPAMRANETSRRELYLPTDRRAVLEVGPIQAVRGDPIGLSRRCVTSGPQQKLVVWPRVVTMPATGAGVIRDLDGRTTNEPSPSDAAFHALREYVPGDDRRHVHWRTSMRMGQLMVRQFVDVRRSELTVVLGVDAEGFASDDEFETAVSVVASVAVRAFSDQVGLRLLIDGQDIPGHSRGQVLDALAAVRSRDDATSGQAPALTAAQLVLKYGRTLSGDVLIVTGTHVPMVPLAGAAARLGPDVSVSALRVQLGAGVTRSRSGRMLVMQIGSLEDLAAAVHDRAVA